MRLLVLALLALLGVTAASADARRRQTDRFGVAADAKTYPQATPKEALASVVKAVDAGKFAYLVAHLADPTFVDDRVKRIYGGKFDEQVQDTRASLDPLAVKRLKQFAKDGTWQEEKATATVTLKDVKERVVRLVKRGDRWYLEHSSSPR